MPQLMPLMWIMSFSMIFFIFLMLLMMYFSSINKMLFDIYFFNMVHNNKSIKYMW